MAEKKYSKQGALYKAQQAQTKEPSIPETQNLARMRRSTQYLALHQTIASSLTPFSRFFEDNQQEEGSPEAGKDRIPEAFPLGTLAVDYSSFIKIKELIGTLTSEPLRKIFVDHYNRFCSYFIQNMPVHPPSERASGDSQVPFSSRDAHGFHSLSSPGGSPLLPGEGPGTSQPAMAWEDPLKEVFLSLFFRIAPPWIEKAVSQRQACDAAEPSEGKTVFSILGTPPLHPWSGPPPVLLLSDYDEVDEQKVDDSHYRFRLQPRKEGQASLDVLYDKGKNYFHVKGEGFTRTLSDGRFLNPQVLVDEKTGKETRVYWSSDSSGATTMEILVHDRNGQTAAKTIERTSRAMKEVEEFLYEGATLRELSVELHRSGDMDLKRRFLYSYSEQGSLEKLSELSTVALHHLSSAKILGLQGLREHTILERYEGAAKVLIESKAEWAPLSQGFALLRRNSSLKIPGHAVMHIKEMEGREYHLSSQILTSSGMPLFRSLSSRDPHVLTQAIHDPEARIQWEQRTFFESDNTITGIHSNLRAPLDESPSSPLVQKVTHMLPGIILYGYDSVQNEFGESKHVIYHFEKLVDYRWIKPSDVKKLENGEVAVTFTYQHPPGCVIEETRNYSPAQGFLFETGYSQKKTYAEEHLVEEKSLKRSFEKHEETAEIVRRKMESEYRETTAVKELATDRFIRSRKKSEKIPSDFFSEPNRWLDFFTEGRQELRCFVNTYIHERLAHGTTPPDRVIMVREETYECEKPGEPKRDILNFLAFLDEEQNTHYRIRATSVRADIERTLVWEDGELTQQFESSHKEGKKAAEPALGKLSRKGGKASPALTRER
ncbi:MAG: hypothetical protein RDV48_21930 [Candidatus Eremiobacteraeota bacterium]|nr:hypothetical protein [Candidatus Eremiobacteraeota bacterium]